MPGILLATFKQKHSVMNEGTCFTDRIAFCRGGGMLLWILYVQCHEARS
jgi:hypothetical protein